MHDRFILTDRGGIQVRHRMWRRVVKEAGLEGA
jgi:hypothetical protein